MRIERTIDGERYVLDVDIEKITPSSAKANLANTTIANRKENNVERFGLDMKAGKWFLSGQPIIFDEDRQLMDGFNRNKASEASGASFVSLVVRGVSRGAHSVLDTGKSRTLADLLRMKEKEYVNLVGYVLKRIVLVEKGRVVASGTATTRTEELAALQKWNTHSALEELAAKAFAIMGPLQRSTMTFLWWYYSLYLGKKVDPFFECFGNFGKRAEGYTGGTLKAAEELYRRLDKGDLCKADQLLHAVAAVQAYLSSTKYDGKARHVPVSIEFTDKGIKQTFAAAV